MISLCSSKRKKIFESNLLRDKLILAILTFFLTSVPGYSRQNENRENLTLLYSSTNMLVDQMTVQNFMLLFSISKSTELSHTSGFRTHGTLTVESFEEKKYRYSDSPSDHLRLIMSTGRGEPHTIDYWVKEMNGPTNNLEQKFLVSEHVIHYLAQSKAFPSLEVKSIQRSGQKEGSFQGKENLFGTNSEFNLTYKGIYSFQGDQNASEFKSEITLTGEINTPTKKTIINEKRTIETKTQNLKNLSKINTNYKNNLLTPKSSYTLNANTEKYYEEGRAQNLNAWIISGNFTENNSPWATLELGSQFGMSGVWGVITKTKEKIPLEFYPSPKL